MATTDRETVRTGPPLAPSGTSIALLAGEASGDAYGAALARELQRLVPDVKLWGLGGARMRSAGVELLFDCGDWAAIGIVQSLRVFPKLRFRVFPALIRELKSRRPDVVVPVDFGAFNVPVCRICKRIGLRVLYYLPPGSWKREGPPPTNLAQVTDRIATQFSWSRDRLAAAGADVEWVGHPLLDLLAQQDEPPKLPGEFGWSPEAEVVAILPGSRHHEILYNSPALAEAAVLIHRRRPNARFLVALAQTVNQRQVETLMDPLLSLKDEEGRPVAAVARGRTHEALAASSVGLICSGTATLEAAILGVPMVILYRGGTLMRIEYVLRGLKRLRWIGLPNIIADRTVVPELIDRDAEAAALTEAALRILTDPEYADAMRRELAEVRSMLGMPGATARTARLVLDLASGANGATSQQV